MCVITSTGNVSGTITPSSSLSLIYNWTYNSLYNYPSSLAAISGSWIGALSAGGGGEQTLQITTTGAISVQNPTGTCTITGQVSLIDPLYNAYAVSLTFAGITGDCQGPLAATGQGIAYLDYTQSPTVLNMAVNMQLSPNTSTWAILAAQESN
jgi:hypothetical protein